MTDNDTIEMTANIEGKEYPIAYSLREQKRANDLKEIELKQRKEWQWIVLGICLFLLLLIVGFVYWMHIYNIPTRILT